MSDNGAPPIQAAETSGAGSKAGAPAAPRELHLTRVFDAPRELVWQAWTEPARLAAWWGPTGWTAPVCELELKPGGRLFIEMKGPEPWGSHPMGGAIEEVTPPERLVFIARAFGSDAEGWQLENRNTITLTDLGGKTELRLDVEVLKAGPAMAGALAGMEMGWNQSLDKLGQLLGGEAKPALQLTTYLFFAGDCAEAFQAYAALFGGQVEALMPHRGTPAEQSVPEEWRDKIIHARLRIGGQLLMASDAQPSHSETPQGFYVSAQVPTPEEAERVWAGLAEGGKVIMPLAGTFFARRFGMLRDRFGTPWMVNCE
jgi:PhnB protein